MKIRAGREALRCFGTAGERKRHERRPRGKTRLRQGRLRGTGKFIARVIFGVRYPSKFMDSAPILLKWLSNHTHARSAFITNACAVTMRAHQRVKPPLAQSIAQARDGKNDDFGVVLPVVDGKEGEDEKWDASSGAQGFSFPDTGPPSDVEPHEQKAGRIRDSSSGYRYADRSRKSWRSPGAM